NTSNAHIQFNRSRSEITNLNSGVNNIEGALGITGVSTNPFDWGVPSVSFTHFLNLADINPALRRNQTLSLGENMSWSHGRHNLHYGADFRRIQLNNKFSSNARGSFVFTGFATAANAGGTPVAGTGYDFADFLLGLPQQTSAQYGINSYYFRGNSWDAFLTDD